MRNTDNEKAVGYYPTFTTLIITHTGATETRDQVAGADNNNAITFGVNQGDKFRSHFSSDLSKRHQRESFVNSQDTLRSSRLRWMHQKRSVAVAVVTGVCSVRARLHCCRCCCLHLVSRTQCALRLSGWQPVENAPDCKRQCRIWTGTTWFVCTRTLPNNATHYCAAALLAFARC